MASDKPITAQQAADLLIVSARVMESPLQNPPHVGHHPQTVFAMVGGFVDKVRLLSRYPRVGLRVGKVQPAPAQRCHKILCMQVLIAFGVAQNGLVESRGDV